jgi:hypothetical protein
MKATPLAALAFGLVMLLAVQPATHSASAAARALPPAVQAIAPMNGLCDASDVLDVLGDLSEASAAKKRIQIALLAGRLTDCATRLRAVAAVPTPYWIAPDDRARLPAAARTPSPVCVSPPPATTASNRFELYEDLQRCASYVAALDAAASPDPNASTPPSIAARPTFYVFAVGAAEASAATVLIRSAVARLAGSARHTGPEFATAPASPDIVVSGRADWTSVDTFTAQCQFDPNTRGALVIETSIPETYHSNYLIIAANFTTVSASIEVLGCGAEDHRPTASPLSLVSRQDVNGKAHQDAWTLGIFTTLATLLATSGTKTTVTTGGGTTTVSRTDSTAPVFAGSILGYYENQNLTLPAQNASVALNVAANRFAEAMMQRLSETCADRELRALAAAADPAAIPAPPPEHRTRLYQAAFEYAEDCALFANFATH